MTLQATNTVNTFAANCLNIWNKWPNDNSTQREMKFKYAIVTMTGFMHPMNIHFTPLNGDFGSFSWSSWRLEVDRSFTVNNNIKYKDFVELCATVYHETRHAEQFFRIAQGLSSGDLTFPDYSKEKVINDFSGQMNSVKARVAAFQGQNLTPTAQMIAKHLDIPLAVAQKAETAKGGFTPYINLAKPTWYKRKTNLLTVEEWMRSTYKKSLGGMNEWAQSDEGTYDLYRDLPEEHDAHEIEALISTAVKARIGHNYPLNKNKPRNDAIF